MENNQEVERFRRRSVFVICRAGSDRSKYIAEELEERGYVASHGGTLKSQNYVTTSDLAYIGSVIFSSVFEKDQFDKDTKLKDFVKGNGINIYVMNITESDKNRAHDSGKVQELKGTISSQLDVLGFKNLLPGKP
jgi:hypothetical protein